MKKIYIKVSSEPVKNDWIHEYYVSDDPLDRDEEEFEDILEFDVKDDTNEIYVVFRFFENYIDNYYLHYDHEAAEHDFLVNVEEFQKIFNEDEYQVLEKSYNKDLRSTIYVKGMYDKYEWPDKSNRWVMKKFQI